MTTRRAGVGPVRVVGVVGLALLIAFQLFRSAAVSQPFAKRPAWAAMLWPDHPRILLDRSMAAIGTAAARGEVAPTGATEAITSVARRAPLEATPFLVTGAIAQTEGREQAAARLFLQARLLDPRAPAARYFLADHYLRTGQVTKGLAEMAVLSRLTPRSREAFIPALAAYARTPGSLDHLAGFLRSSPEFKPLVLETLAQDPANADLVLRLAGPGPFSKSEATLAWQQVLLAKVVEERDYARAHAIWRRLTGDDTRSGTLFNPAFRELAAPPPFNWTFHEGAGGLAEPAPGGRLQVLYYGRTEVGLASQMLLLGPGQYTLRMTASGDPGTGGLHWSVRCLPADRPILELPVKPGATRGSFVVPSSGCPAQWLELRGRASDSPRPAELTIGEMNLAQGAGA